MSTSTNQPDSMHAAGESSVIERNPPGGHRAGSVQPIVAAVAPAGIRRVLANWRGLIPGSWHSSRSPLNRSDPREPGRRSSPAGRGAWALGIVGASLLLFAGCGDDDDESAGEGETPRATNTIANATSQDAAEPTATGIGGTEAPGGVQESLELTARDLQFDKDELTVESDSQVSLVFHNEENVPHNVSIYESEEAEEEIFVGDIVTGETITYEFQAPVDSGDYFFRCDVHPDMTGTFVVN